MIKLLGDSTHICSNINSISINIKQIISGIHSNSSKAEKLTYRQLITMIKELFYCFNMSCINFISTFPQLPTDTVSITNRFFKACF